MVLRAQLASLEEELSQHKERAAAARKLAATEFEERLHIELKQQQLRYDRRLQV